MRCDRCAREGENFAPFKRGRVTKHLCPDCDHRTPTCAVCGDRNKNFSIYYTLRNGVYTRENVCVKCIEMFPQCSGCESHVSLAEIKHFEGKMFCPNCFEELVIPCVDCGKLHVKNPDYEGCCGECYKKKFYVCESCGRTSPKREKIICRICGGCAQCCGHAIRSYSYKPEWVFFGENTPYTYGVEVELHNVDSKFNNKYVGITASNMGRGFVFCKGDASIGDGTGNGLEIVSHPASISHHKNVFDWTKLLSEMNKMGLKGDEEGKTVGIHVHVGNDALTPTNGIKVAGFIHRNKKNIEKFSRREGNRYCKFVTKRAKTYGDNQDRYEAVNFQTRKTVEIRVFKSTTKPNIFFSALEFVDALVHFVNENSFAKVLGKNSWDNFQQYVSDNAKKNKWTFLPEYMANVGQKVSA